MLNRKGSYTLTTTTTSPVKMPSSMVASNIPECSALPLSKIKILQSTISTRHCSSSSQTLLSECKTKSSSSPLPSPSLSYSSASSSSSTLSTTLTLTRKRCLLLAKSASSASTLQPRRQRYRNNQYYEITAVFSN